MDNRFFETLDLICERPALYIGTTSLSVLYGWVLGWNSASDKTPNDADLPSREFNEFVKVQLSYYEATRGWRRMILDSCGGNEEAAFYKFVQLYKLYRARTADLSPTATNTKA